MKEQATELSYSYLDPVDFVTQHLQFAIVFSFFISIEKIIFFARFMLV